MIAKPASPKAFKPMTPAPHFRAADIDRDQPSFTAAVRARGNGDERVHGFGRGK